MRFALAAIGALAFGSDAIETPYRGCVAGSGEVRQVYGARSSFVTTAPLIRGALSAACSDRRVVVKTQDALVILDRNGSILHSQPAGEGQARIALNVDGEPAWAWLTEPKIALEWTGESWIPAPPAFDGDVLGIASHGAQWIAVQRREDRLWLTRLNGLAVIGDEPLGGPATAALPLPDGSVWLGSGTRLRLRLASGIKHEFEMPSPVISLLSMKAGWIAVETAAGTVAIEQTRGGARLYRIAGSIP
jgi:hypothetical protein